MPKEKKYLTEFIWQIGAGAQVSFDNIPFDQRDLFVDLLDRLTFYSSDHEIEGKRGFMSEKLKNHIIFEIILQNEKENSEYNYFLPYHDAFIFTDGRRSCI